VRRALLLLAATLATGCAQNAVLEIEMQLPSAGPDGAPSPYTEASVRFALDTDGPENDVTTFDAWTSGDGPTPRAFTLSERRADDEPRRTFPSNLRLSVRTGQVDADLLLQIRFCRPNGICDPAPELRYHVEHPFYRGQRTFLRTGPIDPSGGSYTYNLTQDFPELCRQPSAVDPNVRVIWRCRIEGCFDSTIGEVVSADYGWCAMGDDLGYTMPDASCDDGSVRTVPDASGRLLGEIDVRPQHFCERAHGCSVGPTRRTGSPLLLLALAPLLLARKRRRQASKRSFSSSSF
jgi:hypothetical protein